MMKQENYVSQVNESKREWPIGNSCRRFADENLRLAMHNNEPNVQECDARDDATSVAAGLKKNNFFFLSFAFCVFCFMFFISSCGIYTFKDVTIPPEVKTIKINFIENRASYKNPQLSPRLTDQLQQKISSQTRLTRVNSDDAHYQISGYISNYSVSTSAISSQSGSRQQTSNNRLSVSVHISLLNTLDGKTSEYDVNRDFEFSATISFQQAEASLLNDIVKNMSDEIFNRIFSNW